MDELSPSELRQANQLSRQQRMLDRERREKSREAKFQHTRAGDKQRRVETVAPRDPNEVAAAAAEDLLATLTTTVQ